MYRHLEHRLAQRIVEFLRSRYPDATLPQRRHRAASEGRARRFCDPRLSFRQAAPHSSAQDCRSHPRRHRSDRGHRGNAGCTSRLPECQNRSRLDGSPPSPPTRSRPSEFRAGKILVEHTSINPNKAAHIGHLRNAILGDTFVRLLRFAGREVDVQNYIDNTGVQVADVVVGFTHIEKKSRAEIEALASQPRFDYYCWDLYARVSQWYAQDKQNLQARRETLHAIEDAASDTAAIAELISTAVLHRHLETMDRLDIEYDFLPRESEILHLHFWDAAFTKLKETGVLTYENEGKNKGCWVMRRAGTTATHGAADASSAPAGFDPPADQISEEDQKVIVRSNGTVGYVGKDIAYHMWKFGLLGRDFAYRKFYRYPNQHDAGFPRCKARKTIRTSAT